MITIGPPKSEAGKRVVSVPAMLLPYLREHMETYAEQTGDGHVFVGPKGARLRRANFTRVWTAALRKAGLSGFHFHDLRHTGNTLAAQSGATLRDLMTRMSHSTTRAALIYQHTAMERDRAIADALGRLAEEALKKQDPDGSGT
ncbi:tyrosine-type recombinase/integrase [Nonomuraea rhodomycinica]|uniref:tyrosine-type recombinase/integrase n=1 Tax=Nonomuraea rhodomycinica TaxID=1712872 RepID=UPI001C37AB3B|nr:tyrosine-type recombinase/integrase [Nonomuraea rhodomycinica]